VVSQQVPSSLRQSVFLKGKLILSRLVPIASFYQGDYASDVVRDIEATQRYLLSQRIIDRNDLISIQILCNKRHLEKLTIKMAEDSSFDGHIYNINDFIEKEKIRVAEEQDFSSVLYCYLATRKTFPNHYAGNREKKYFYHHIAALAIRIVSIALISVSLGMLMISVAKGFLYESSINEMKLLEQTYTLKFNRLNERKVDLEISTSDMKNVVQTVEKIEKNYLRSPAEMMALVSQDITLFNDMRVTGMKWIVASSADADRADTQASKLLNKRDRRSRRDLRKGKKLYEIANVDGVLLNFDGDYRYALSLINDLEDTMKVSNKYDVVEITRRPLNIEPDESLSGDVSRKPTHKQPAENAEFSFRVVREVRLNGK